jgi:hypothetical protein
MSTENGYCRAASEEIFARLRAMRHASPTSRACSFLLQSCGLVHAYQLQVSMKPDLSEIITPTLMETFSSMLVLDLLVDTEVDTRITEHLARYLMAHRKDGMFWFFEDPSLVPPDVDSVAVGLSALARAGAVDLSSAAESAVIERIVSNCTSDGIIQVYFPPRENREERIDPVVCANALCLLHLAGRGHEARKTEGFLYSVLESRAYMQGTRYYPMPETFLYFLSHAMSASSSLRERFLPLMRERVRESLDHEGTAPKQPLFAALRLIAANAVGHDDPDDTRTLIDTQRPDGSWEAHPLGTTGGRRMRLYFGSRPLTTAFALHALSAPSPAAGIGQASNNEPPTGG